MAFDESNANGMVMPVSPMYGNGGNGAFGGDWAWIILLLLLGWGNNGWGNNGGYGGGSSLYPWMNQAEITSDGFRDQMLNSNITGIRDAVTGISSQLCNGFAQAEIGANARQMADMNRSFALQSQFADCCCENRLGIADLKYTVATENCADRTQSLMNTRDIIDSQTNGTRAILDKLCSLELDAKNDEIAQLRQELLYSRGQASQIAQNATIIDGIYNRLDACPVGTTPVFGRTPIFTCNNNSGCGCGCGSGF